MPFYEHFFNTHLIIMYFQYFDLFLHLYLSVTSYVKCFKKTRKKEDASSSKSNTRKKSYEYKQFPSYNIYYVSLDIIK